MSYRAGVPGALAPRIQLTLSGVVLAAAPATGASSTATAATSAASKTLLIAA